MKKISIIIVSYRVKQLLLICLKSIEDTCQDLEYEIVLVDNCSDDGTVDFVRSKYQRINLIANKTNIGFAQANNQAYQASRGEYLLLLNPDTVVKPGAVRTVLDFMERTPDCGLAGCRLLNTDGSLQRSIKRFPSPLDNLLAACCLNKIFYSTEWRSKHFGSRPFRVDYVSGAFMMIKRRALEKEPYLLNPDFYMYSEEKDLALRLKARGWHCYFVPHAEIVHHGGRSTDQMPERMFLELQKSQVKYFYTHHQGVYARLLDFTWWLVLVSAWLKSLPLYLRPGQGGRPAMMWRAVKEYTKYERPKRG